MDAFVVSGFDVNGKILNDGETLQNVEFVLFNSKNVSVIHPPPSSFLNRFEPFESNRINF